MSQAMTPDSSRRPQRSSCRSFLRSRCCRTLLLMDPNRDVEWMLNGCRSPELLGSLSQYISITSHHYATKCWGEGVSTHKDQRLTGVKPGP